MKAGYGLMTAIVLVFSLVATQAIAQNGPRLIINEVLADPDGSVELGDANMDGVRMGGGDEFVELANVTGDTIDLTGWRVGDDEDINFRFPDGYKLPPRTFLVIFGDGDVSNVTGYDADPLLTRVFSADSTVGNGFANGGDYVLIISPDSTEDAYFSYGGQAMNGPPTSAVVAGITFEYGWAVDLPGNQNQSITRNPDGDFRAEAMYALHTEVGTTPHSPGTTIDGRTVVPKVTPPVTLIINEVLADPATSVELGDSNNDGVRNSRDDEFVEFANAGPDTLDLSGWQVGDDEIVHFTFPDGYKLAPREMLVIWGGGDITNAPGYNADPLLTKAFSADSGVGNGLANGGDYILVLSPDGAYDMYFGYGSKFGSGGPVAGTFPDGTEFEFELETATAAGADNSITRFPDGNILVPDPFVQHLTVSEAPFSPNTTIDGKLILPKPQPPITIVINEILADPGATVETGDANRDGTVTRLEDQFVEIVNPSEESVDLGGWQLGDGSGFSFTFPAGYTIAPNAMIAVFGGGDITAAPGYAADQMLTRVFAASGSIGDGLDDSGDHVTLLSADGSYDTYIAYGSASGMGAPQGAAFDGIEWEFEVDIAAVANMDNSVTRDPDGEFLDSDPFVQHGAVSELPFSPAQTTEGLPSLDAFVDVLHPWGTGQVLAFNYMERDRVEVRDAAMLVPLQMDAGTVEMWFRPDMVIADDTHPPDFTYLFSKNVSGNVIGDLGIAWSRGEGRLQFFIQDGTVTQSVYSHPNEFGNKFDPRWYHVACTWEVGDSIRMFIDGVPSVVADSSEIPVFGGEQMFAIGNGAINLFNSRFEAFRGMIDEVRFSLIARYKEPFEPATQPFDPDQFTLALWHFDEGAGNITADATGNGFTGFLGGTGDDSVATRPMWVDASTLVSVDDEPGAPPEVYLLSQNYPNPFNPSTQIDFAIPNRAHVELAVYNLLGQKIKVLIDKPLRGGTYTANFSGVRFSTGVYFYVLKVDDRRIVKKMTLLK